MSIKGTFCFTATGNLSIAMDSTFLVQGLQNLETELQDSFARIQGRLQLLREDVGSATPAETFPVTPVPVPKRRDSLKVPDSLGDWLLKDDVMSIPYEEPSAVPLSGDALFLSAEMLGASAHSHMRLNPHLMELSMRAAESAQVLKKERMNSKNFSLRKADSKQFRMSLTGELQACESFLAVLPPNSPFRLVWDLCGVLLIVLDAFLLPMTMAWSEWEVSPMPASTTFSSRLLQLFAITSLIFWPCDILVNFNTAFYIRGFIETSRWEIAKRYAKTWLSFDVCVVALDFLAGFLGQAGQPEFCTMNVGVQN